MSMTDPIGDLLTRIRNGGKAGFDKVDVPASRMKIALARIFKDEGFIKNYKLIKDNKQGILRIYLRYDDRNQPLIQRLERVSRPVAVDPDDRLRAEAQARGWAVISLR